MNSEKTNPKLVVLGGHRMEIVNAAVVHPNPELGLLYFELDCAKDDVQPNLFKSMLDDSGKHHVPWPEQAVVMIPIFDERGMKLAKIWCLNQMLERSNPGCRFRNNVDRHFADQYVGKKIGAVFGNVRRIWDGKIYTEQRIRTLYDINAVKDAEVPAVLTKRVPPAVQIMLDAV